MMIKYVKRKEKREEEKRNIEIRTEKLIPFHRSRKFSCRFVVVANFNFLSINNIYTY